MFRRIALMMAMVIIAIIIVSSALTILELRSLHYDEVRNQLVLTARMAAGSLDEMGTVPEDLTDFARRIARQSGVRVTLVDRRGNVLGDSEAAFGTMENHFYREEIQAAYSGKIGVSQRYSRTLDKEMFYVAYPYDGAQGLAAVIRVALPMKSVSELIRAEIGKIAAVTVLGILFSLMLSQHIVTRMVQPIRRLSAASARISEGEYGLNVMVESPDEIGELTKSFNAMSDRLRLNMVQSQESAVKIQAILTSMVNGIIAVDTRRHIMFVNPMAERMLGIQEAQVRGRHVLEVIRDNRLDECLERFLMTDLTAPSDIEIYEPAFRILSIAANPILSETGDRLGIVIMMQDVTEIRKLEQMRKDFVANVSHELKTPLTSIQGFVETLKAGAAERKEVRDRFLDILDIESSRLSALIDDLLMLSDIESKAQHNPPVRIATGGVAREVVEMLSPLAQRKSILLTLESEQGLPEVMGHPGWFKQMLINLVDNAIKYTPEEGAVHITLHSDARAVILKVEDTGIGIAPEHIGRLFERFYRVDKARSREVGGTGLGLAIVKHIVIAMGGQIRVTSEPGSGTCFTVVLPLAEGGVSELPGRIPASVPTDRNG